MIRTRALASIGLVLAGAVLLPAATLQAQNSASVAATAHRATLELYCIGCHSGPTPFAGLNLQALDTDLGSNCIDPSCDRGGSAEASHPTSIAIVGSGLRL